MELNQMYSLYPQLCYLITFLISSQDLTNYLHMFPSQEV